MTNHGRTDFTHSDGCDVHITCCSWTQRQTVLLWRSWLHGKCHSDWIHVNYNCIYRWLSLRKHITIRWFRPFWVACTEQSSSRNRLTRSRIKNEPNKCRCLLQRLRNCESWSGGYCSSRSRVDCCDPGSSINCGRARRSGYFMCNTAIATQSQLLALYHQESCPTPESSLCSIHKSQAILVRRLTLHGDRKRNDSRYSTVKPNANETSGAVENETTKHDLYSAGLRPSSEWCRSTTWCPIPRCNLIAGIRQLRM